MVAGQVPDDSSRQELDALWRATQDRLRASVPESTYRLWLRAAAAVGCDDGTLYLTAPEGIRAWAERRYSSLIGEALAGSGSGLTRVGFCPDGERVQVWPRPPRARSSSTPTTPSTASSSAPATGSPTAPRWPSPRRRRRPTTPSSCTARPASARPTCSPRSPTTCRPTLPALSVRYTTAESFTNEFVGALKSAGAEAFKSRYRDIDVLLIDDVQFLEGKPATEEEFFHTFNALYESGSQLVLSADRIPSELSTLASRLRDRFEWGLTVPVEPPNLATRLTVLRRLVQEAGVEIADTDALTELANRIDANVRQLHGALTRVIAHASLMARPLSSELIAEVIPRSRSAQATSVEEIQQRVAEGYRHLAGGADRLQPRRDAAAGAAGRDLPDPRADRPLAAPDRPPLRRPRSLHRPQLAATHRSRPRRRLRARRSGPGVTRRYPQSDRSDWPDGRWHCKNHPFPHSRFHRPETAPHRRFTGSPRLFQQALFQLKKAFIT